MTISTARIGELQQLGFIVEDMEYEYGSEFSGQYRWMNDEMGEFQDSDVSYSIADAWTEADLFAQTCVQ